MNHCRSTTPFLLLSVFLLAGCAIIDPNDIHRSVDFDSDQAFYEVFITERTDPFMNFDIPLELRNTGNADIILTGCINPSLPVLQKRLDDEWVTVYAVVELACSSPPWVLHPGDMHRDTLRVRTRVKLLSNTEFIWVEKFFDIDADIPVNGQYRLERRIFADTEGQDLLPLADRVSNSFRIMAVPNPTSN